MSVEAMSWALNLAPMPADRGGQPSSACKFVLVGLASHAGPDGTGAFPSVATLVRYTGLSERTVRSCLDRLAAVGVIRPCDPDIVAAWIKRADRRPKGWDLDLSLIRDDLTETDLAALEHQFPGLAARVAAAACPDPGEAADGVQSLHPAGGVDNRADGVQALHPVSGPGCNEHTGGVQPAQPRGAAVAPEPSLEPSREPSAAPGRGRGALPAAGGFASGGRAVEFFAALGPAWPLTAAQQSRLAPAVLAALADGWTPQELAGFTGANSGGVRNPCAVLAARLSPAELPSPSGTQLVRRPPWCGQCDERTRRCEDAQGADAGRCSVCHPLADAALAAGTAGAAVDDLGLTGAGCPAGGRDPVSVTAYDWTRARCERGVRSRG